jgi:tetratricopeptide (TPR) repeat protein
MKRGKPQREKKSNNAAIDDFDRSIAPMASGLRMHFELGNQKLFHGNYKGAIADYLKAYALQPLLIKEILRREQAKATGKHLAKAGLNYERHEAETYFRLGITSADDFFKAQTNFFIAIRDHANLNEAYIAMAIISIEKGRCFNSSTYKWIDLNPRAYYYYNRAIQLQPEDNPVAYYGLALWSKNHGCHNNALAYLQIAKKQKCMIAGLDELIEQYAKDAAALSTTALPSPENEIAKPVIDGLEDLDVRPLGKQKEKTICEELCNYL